jgi:ABC-type branched-subunit amino acid transport system substrate-binding protein
VHRRRWIGTIAVVAVAGAFASTGALTGPAGARVGGVRGVTASEIRVAGLAQTSQFFENRIKAGANARFNEENQKGGVFHRKLTYVETADDKGDPTTDLTEAQRLVQQDQVFGVLTLTPSMTQAARFFAQQHVPFFGWGIDAGYCKNPYALGFTGCIVPPADNSIPNTGTTWGALMKKYLQSIGQSPAGKTAATISEDNATGKEGTAEIAAQAKYGGGFKVTYAQNPVPITPPGDYSPYVTALTTSNSGKAPDIIYLTLSFPNLQGLGKALLAANYRGILTNAVGYDPTLVSVFPNQPVFTQFDLPEDTSNATMQRISNEIKALDPSGKVSQPALAAYFAADAFIAALKKVGKNLTAEGFAKVLAKGFTYQIPGIVGPTKYPAAQTQGAPCGTLVVSDGTAYKIAVPYACYQNINLNNGKVLKY